jgi:hypothetical protein
MKRVVAALSCLFPVLLGCTERSRPDPFGPDSPVRLAADVLAPRTSESVAAGSTVSVRVHATEAANRLTGVGFVARRFGSSSALIDSVTVHFVATDDTTHVFSLDVPGDLPSNTQIDIAGLAFAATSQSVRSALQSVVVIGR